MNGKPVNRSCSLGKRGEATYEELFAATQKLREKMAVVHALADEGIDVPGKVAVTGFDDIPAAGQFIPPLTTFHQPFREMVQEAFQSIVGCVEPKTIVLKGALVVRETA